MAVPPSKELANYSRSVLFILSEYWFQSGASKGSCILLRSATKKVGRILSYVYS